MPLALSTGHMVGLGVAAGAFIAFALAASFLFPRFNPQFPGGGLSAFIVVAFVFFFGMLAAVEVFGAESGHAEGRVAETSTGGEQPTTVQRTTTQQQQTTTTAQTTTASTAKTTTSAPAAQSLAVTETEFKIAMPSTLKASKYTFEVKNDGKLPHDLAIKGGAKSKLIQPGASAQLVTTLKAGKYTFYCSVPGHEQAGMKVDVTVS
ncbi:MAG TPA: cupredoxin domain-containing protein [Gaiellaceae bacterium]|nr:cupredoxin domain-containing protein [Gaiellaceae bacterium]